jgi:hypothetical protein
MKLLLRSQDVQTDGLVQSRQPGSVLEQVAQLLVFKAKPNLACASRCAQQEVAGAVAGDTGRCVGAGQATGDNGTACADSAVQVVAVRAYATCGFCASHTTREFGSAREANRRSRIEIFTVLAAGCAAHTVVKGHIVSVEWWASTAVSCCEDHNLAWASLARSTYRTRTTR